ncbi:hypothetical protein KBY58_06745 [Cyanobium sp. HWJ4-Hawea]|nr:hypothetical protein [Cyanobium sp. HWJ4-Hawea]
MALFSGSDETTHWQRNVDASAVIKGEWQGLPLEILIPVDQLREQGLWQEAEINRRAWQLRLIQLRQRLAEQAEGTGEARLEAQQSLMVADQLELLVAGQTEGDGETQRFAQQAIGWRLRAAEALVVLWQRNQETAVAVELAQLFGELSQRHWPGDDKGPINAGQNSHFWWSLALQQAANSSEQGEQAGDLERAAEAASDVLEISAAYAEAMKG